MENIMANEEVVEVAEEVVTTGSGKAGKVVVGLGLIALGGAVLYKRVIKPIIAKVKAKKEARKTIKLVDDGDEGDVKMIYDENGNPIE